MKNLIVHLRKGVSWIVLFFLLTVSGCAAIQAGEGTDTAVRDGRDAAWIESDSPFGGDR